MDITKELDEAIAFLATAKQMSLSEFLETRLRMLPEIQKQIERFQNLPEDPIIDVKIKDQISPDAPTRIFSKIPIAHKRGKPLSMDDMSRKDHMRFEKILLEQIKYLQQEKFKNEQIVTIIKRQRDFFKKLAKR